VLKRRERSFSEGRSDFGDGYLRYSVVGVSRSHIHCFLSPLVKLFSFLTTTKTTTIIIITVQFLQYLNLSAD
jgi:hypothetical protein